MATIDLVVFFIAVAIASVERMVCEPQDARGTTLSAVRART